MAEDPAAAVGNGAGGPVLGTAALAGWIGDLARLDRQVGDAERVDQIRLLEELKAAAAAAQARATAALDASQRGEQAAAGVHRDALGKGVAAQVGMARRESPVRGAQHLGLAKALVSEMPHTLAALATGRLSEWRATLLVRETAHLSRAHRAVVDRELAGCPERLEGLGDRALVARARTVGYRLDPAAAVRRARRSEQERRVTCRPAPDTMAYLTALLPVKQAVAAFAALTRAADSARADGDSRSRGQVMADTLVERVTGQATADAVPVQVGLVMTDRSLLRGDHEPAHLPGYGPVPAPLARDWVCGVGDVDVWLRRRHLPHALVRRAHPTHRPSSTPRGRRPHQRRQRPGAVRGLQLHEASAGLDLPSRSGSAAHRRHHHPDRTRLPLDRTAPSGRSTLAGCPASAGQHPGGPLRRTASVSLTAPSVRPSCARP